MRVSQLICFFFDFSKAFDKVCHDILLQKLSEIGINNEILVWLNIFLTQRSMQVKVSDSFSRPRPVTSGVPQGTVVGPLLFLVYINYALSEVSCRFKVFADDVKLYFTFSYTDPTSLGNNQSDVDSFVSKSASWGLNLNSNKCVAMRFSPKSVNHLATNVSPYKIGNSHIKFVTSHSDLGITIDQSLKFHNHIRMKTASVNNLVTNLLSCTISRNSEFMLNIFTMHIRPLLEYGCQVWNTGYLGDLKMLERIQRRWTREIDGMQGLEYSERLRKLDLFSIQGRLLRADLLLVWKIIHKKSALKSDHLFQLIPDRSTRGHKFKIFVQRARLEHRRRFFSLRVIKCWNSLSRKTVEAETIEAFKRCLKVDLGDSLFSYVD